MQICNSAFHHATNMSNSTTSATKKEDMQLLYISLDYVYSFAIMKSVALLAGKEARRLQKAIQEIKSHDEYQINVQNKEKGARHNSSATGSTAD